jgi:hypothetical protein
MRLFRESSSVKETFNDPVDGANEPIIEIRKSKIDNPPGLGVDWGSNIDPGPGPDPRTVSPDAPKLGRHMAA